MLGGSFWLSLVKTKMVFKKKLRVRVPQDIKALYCPKKNILSLIGKKSVKSFKPDLKVVIITDSVSKMLYVSNVPIKNFSNSMLKKLPDIQGMLVAAIKNNFSEATRAFYKKLRLVGVGYRILLGTNVNITTSLTIKLGYSHLLYCKLPNGLSIFCRKYIKPIIFGKSSWEAVSQTAAKIRNLRKPEPYKGKGVLYKEEKIILKQGKRV